METSEKKPQKRKSNYMPLGLSVGVAFALTIGKNMFEETGTSLAFFLPLGLLFGYLLDRQAQKKEGDKEK